MSFRNNIFRFASQAIMALAMVCLTACSMMTEDLAPCQTKVRVYIKYDYNTTMGDLLSPHAGWIRLLVIDNESNLVVKDTVVSNRDDNNVILLHPNSQTFYVEMDDLKAEHSYRFSAVALQCPEDEVDKTGADYFKMTIPTVGENQHKLGISLTHTNTPNEQGLYAVKAPACGLDTLWMGHTTKAVTVPRNTANQIVGDTISMVRDTKYFTISLHNLDETEKLNINCSQYRVEIVSANGILEWNNALTAEQPTLQYNPYAERTSETIGLEDPNDPQSPEIVTERTAHYYLSTSRLMYKQQTAQNAILRITRLSDNKVIVLINLPATLYDGAGIQHYVRWGAQEFLDRCYEYNLDFFLKGDTWEGATLKVNLNMVPWVLRIQNATL